MIAVRYDEEAFDFVSGDIYSCHNHSFTMWRTTDGKRNEAAR